MQDITLLNNDNKQYIKHILLLLLIHMTRRSKLYYRTSKKITMIRSKTCQIALVAQLLEIKCCENLGSAP